MIYICHWTRTGACEPGSKICIKIFNCFVCRKKNLYEIIIIYHTLRKKKRLIGLHWAFVTYYNPVYLPILYTFCCRAVTRPISNKMSMHLLRYFCIRRSIQACSPSTVSYKITLLLLLLPLLLLVLLYKYIYIYIYIEAIRLYVCVCICVVQRVKREQAIRGVPW